MDSTAVKRGPTPVEWEAQKALIRSLFLNNDKVRLSQILERLAKSGFIVTEAQLRYKIKLWGFKQNLTSEGWKYVGHQVRKRRLDGKESDLIVCGARLKPAKVDRGIYRNCTSSLASKFTTPKSPKLPDTTDIAISICTPPSLDMEFKTWPGALPWIQFQTNTQNFFASNPFCSLTSRTSRFGLPTILDLGIQSLGLFRHASLVLRNPSKTAAVIGSVMPEAYEGENVARATALISGSARDSLTEALRILIYRISNGANQDHLLINAFVHLFERIGAARMPLLGYSLLPIGGHTLSAFTNNLFSAFFFALLDLEVPDLEHHFKMKQNTGYDILRWLLVSGCDINQQLVSPWHLDIDGQYGKCATAIQFAAAVGSASLLEFLIEFGADVDLTTIDEPRLPLEMFLEIHEDPTSDQENIVKALLSASGEKSPDKLTKALFQAIKNGWTGVIELFRVHGAPFDSDIPSSTWAWERDDTLKQAARYVPPPESGPPAWFFRHILDTIPEICRQRFLNATPSTYAEVLVAAAWAQNTDVVRYVVALGGDPNVANSRGITPLLAAISNRHREAADLSCVDYLLQELAYAQSDAGEPGILAVHIAASKLDHQLLRCLMDRGFDGNATLNPRALGQDHRRVFQQTLGRSIPFDACDGDWIEAARYRSKNWKRLQKSRSISPLSMATLAWDCLYGLSESGTDYILCIEHLVLHGAVLAGAAGGNQNDSDPEKWSCLQLAIKNEDISPRTVFTLVDAGATIRRVEAIELLTPPLRNGLEALRSLVLMDDEIWTSVLVAQDDISRLEAAIYSRDATTIDWALRHSSTIYSPGALCAAVQLAALEDSVAWSVTLIEEILQHRRKNTETHKLEITAYIIATATKNERLCNLLIPHMHHSTYPYIVVRTGKNIRDLLSCGYWRFPSDLCEDIHIYEFMYRVWPEAFGAELVSLRFPLDRTVLYQVVLRNDLETAEEILKACEVLPVPVSVSSVWVNLLVVAVGNKNLKMVQLLIQHGENVNEEPGGRYSLRTALQMAVEMGDLEMINFLLESGADVNGKPGRYAGATALQLAAIQGFVGIAKLLLDHEPPADINADPAPGFNGRTALEGAAEYGRIDMIQLLLSYGVETTGVKQMQFLRAIRFAERQSFAVAALILKEHRELTDLEITLLADDSMIFPKAASTSSSGSSSETQSETDQESTTGEDTASNVVSSSEAGCDTNLDNNARGDQVVSYDDSEEAFWNWIDFDV